MNFALFHQLGLGLLLLVLALLQPSTVDAFVCHDPHKPNAKCVIQNGETQVLVWSAEDGTKKDDKVCKTNLKGLINRWCCDIEVKNSNNVNGVTIIQHCMAP
ncbi:hypothetical protein O181_063673 [Austropuccinia psidii MF-1]|uniref:Uncharacterized protein n=1 Tax=Austropuccinia psidii MF-1 TaxID=1389203 RepID=A0A9Q3I0T9_9BASI|nr:hypothetical protein [Austropuccinia psidii MF-1]